MGVGKTVYAGVVCFSEKNCYVVPGKNLTIINWRQNKGEGEGAGRTVSGEGGGGNLARDRRRETPRERKGKKAQVGYIQKRRISCVEPWFLKEKGG